MEPGQVEFVDEDGSGVPLERGDDRLDVEPRRTRRGRWPVLALAVVIVAVCGGVLWHQHGNDAKQSTSAPATPAVQHTVAVDPLNGEAVYGGVRPTGELLAEAQREVLHARQHMQCISQVMTELTDMGNAYRSVLAAGGSPREAERAARAALADERDGGSSGASYNTVLRAWQINQSALSKLSGERLSIDMSTFCTD